MGSKKKKGPNEARCIIWALGVPLGPRFFFFSYVVLTTTGPNDPRCVVWALGVSYACHHVSQLQQTHLWPGQRPQKPTKSHSSQQRPMQAHKDGKGPKRCQTLIGWSYLWGMYLFIFAFSSFYSSFLSSFNF